eukprot:c25316_g1_i5 orf=154-1632(+)
MMSVMSSKASCSSISSSEELGMRESRVEIHEESKVSEEAKSFYDAALQGDLEKFKKMLKDGKQPDPRWEVNPLRGVIESESPRLRIVEELLRCRSVDDFLLEPRCPSKGDTLLHLAAGIQKCTEDKEGAAARPDKANPEEMAASCSEKVAIYLIRSLDRYKCQRLLDDGTIYCIWSLPDHKKENVFKRQDFLEATNSEGNTALHIAAKNLRIFLVEEFLLEKRLRINLKNSAGKTAFDVITQECEDCTCLKGKRWVKPWRISIKLRAACAKQGDKLSKHEDEEEVVKEPRPGDLLLVSEDAWNVTTNTILVVATLALTLIFAAIFTVPQTLAPQDGNSNPSSPTKQIQKSLGHLTSFRVFIVSLTIACLFLIFIIIVVLLTITDQHEARAFVLCFSWFCFGINLLLFLIAYCIAIYIYMGYFFTYILIACCAAIATFLTGLLFYFGFGRTFKKTLSHILSSTLLHGFIFTLFSTFLPTNNVNRIISVLSFDT